MKWSFGEVMWVCLVVFGVLLWIGQWLQDRDYSNDYMRNYDEDYGDYGDDNNGRKS